jgi:HlyD family secretion protein
MKTRIFSLVIILGFLHSCGSNEKAFDASGNFEATEYIISAEAAGVLKAFSAEEGRKLRAGELLGFVDSTQLSLKKQQLRAQLLVVESKKPNVQIQLNPIKIQLEYVKSEKARLEKLVSGNAATQKQLDDINAQFDVLQKQWLAQESMLKKQVEALENESEVLRIQIAQIEDQIAKSKIINPIEGTVLNTFAEMFEMVTPGKPLYKIADISKLILKAYVSGNQLATLGLGEILTVRVDDGKGGYDSAKGELIWISEKAEFTPKAIQTKDERASRMFAIKIQVNNSDSKLKMGQYAEVVFK